MDDPKIVFSAPENLEGTLAEMKALGADRDPRVRLLAPPRARPEVRDATVRRWRRCGPAQLLGREVGPLRPDRDDGARPRVEDPVQPRRRRRRTGPRRRRRVPTSRTATGRTRTSSGTSSKAVGTRYSGAFADEAVRQDAIVPVRRLRADAELPRAASDLPAGQLGPEPGQPEPAEHRPDPAARRHLVDLERAEHARVADAAVARGRQPARRLAPRLPRPRRRDVQPACGSPGTETTRSFSARPLRAEPASAR